MKYNFEEIIGHIRKRPAMYIGRLDQTGFHEQFNWFLNGLLVGNSAERNIEFLFHPGISVEIRVLNFPDYFLGSLEDEEDFDSLHHKLDLFLFLALSEIAEISCVSGGKRRLIVGKKGVLEHSLSNSESQSDDLIIKFTPDFEIFDRFELNVEALSSLFRRFAILNRQLRIGIEDRTVESSNRQFFHYPDGLKHELDFLTLSGRYGGPLFKLHWSEQIDAYNLEFAIAYMDLWMADTYQMTYGNNERLTYGGSLLEGILDGLIYAIRAYAKLGGKEIKIPRKLVKRQLVLVASVQSDAIKYGGCTRTKLDMPDLRRIVKANVSNKFLEFMKGQPLSAALLFRELGLISFDEDLLGEYPQNMKRHLKADRNVKS